MKNASRFPLEILAARSNPRFPRRDALRLLAGVSLLPLISVFGCGGSDDSAGTTLDEGGTGDGGATTADGGTTPTENAGTWASGGTAAMTGKLSYPDPFTTGLGSCLRVASTTEGPCTTAADLVRQDISNGLRGLPVRLALKFVDASCNALPGVTVKIWHTNFEGSYSGATPNNNMCLKQQAYSSQNFFRGVQTTGTDGVVYFDTCFPGWYRGRAVHIHFQVKSGSTTYRVSQLFFPEDVTEDVFATHGDYASFGQPDTVVSDDNIMSGIPAAGRDALTVTVARMTDGAMLASKVLTVR